MIRDVVLHLGNEQPLLVDLFERPGPSDVTVLCTNLRTMTGTKPIWIDDSTSVFIFPIAILRFVEIHPGAEEALGLQSGDTRTGSGGGGSDADGDLEIDEDFLRRVREV